MAELVAALITVHGLLSFLSDVYGLFDPSGKTLWLSVDHRHLRPVDDMVLWLHHWHVYQLKWHQTSNPLNNESEQN